MAIGRIGSCLYSTSSLLWAACLIKRAMTPMETRLAMTTLLIRGKRLFWIVRKMDTYVGALLGLPKTLSDDDIDQVFPLEVDDEFITRDGILPMPEGRISLLAASNAHTRLLTILSKVISYIYPVKG